MILNADQTLTKMQREEEALKSQIEVVIQREKAAKEQSEREKRALEKRFEEIEQDRRKMER